ncbi:uncharacterized protein Z519_09918 [Cladophialophora bantiana CBS 173.52]|uniref:Uncharacterized protein n=1 Tax=Cladophialophora bantiana (strain ATCC 10958 / CBS 173.52 / CDC B-1940 / NIH 8579) TaxID=1442370 RepID=A0A0D2EI41_CLAB1|nr:uncharacterized protein Z519_09918 [Cladophialophora bantiana CBS 173.52]KIW89761.1 hypothetical protein Z519_09918 [Cladophialophora bantiana CBS 173.52]
MSDIEDYTYSPYDDLEDILWDADPTPELADDLAEHTVHSPVYQDEDAVKNELDEYYSDWEYYSDDYMDDDPTLLRKNPQISPPAKPPPVGVQDSRRGKKRKLVETIDIPLSRLDEDRLLVSGIKGTIWAEPSGRKTPAYNDGQEERVALMKNWKDIFAIKNNGWNQSPERTGDDESWAKDMSLEDMGLRHVQRQSSFDQRTQHTEANFEEEDEAAESIAEEVPGKEHNEHIVNSKEVPAPNLTKPRHAVVGKEDDEGGGVFSRVGKDNLRSGNVASQSEVLGNDELPRKRRRVKAGLPSPPDSSETMAADTDEAEIMSEAMAYPKRDGHQKDDTSVVNGIDISQVKPPIINEPGPQRENKRKATEEVDEVGPPKSTTNSRAKRVASKTGRNSQNVAATSAGSTNLGKKN